MEGNGLRYQVTDHERRIGKLEDAGAGADHEKRIRNLEKYNLGVFDQRLKNLDHDLAEARDEMRAMKRALWAFVFSVLGGVLIFLLTVVTGGISA